jgi:3-hydroxyacyl-CoA dehydrogenase
MSETIGIVGAGFQGTAIAVWFARQSFFTVLYDIDPEQLKKIEIELQEGKGKKRPYKDFLKLTGRLEDLKSCDLIIENIPENLSLKQEVFKQLEGMVKKRTILASNSSTFPPTIISEPLKNRRNFINIHYLGVSWGQAKLELVPGKYTSDTTFQRSGDILRRAKFKPIKIGECRGFIYNRIKLVEIANLLRTVEMGMVSLEQAIKYLLIPKRNVSIASLDFLGLDITDASIRSLNEQYGDRYYISRILTEKVEKNELGMKTGKGFLDYSQESLPDSSRPGGQRVHSSLQRVYIHRLQINNTNLVMHMIRGEKQIFLNKENQGYFSLLKTLDERLYSKVLDSCQLIDIDRDSCHFDVIMDFPPLEPIESIIQRINELQEKFGDSQPYVVNLPIYKIEEIAQGTRSPSAVLGMNIQRTYVSNTELVQNDSLDRHRFDEIKELIAEVTGDCIEVSDGFARPLTFLLTAKMFEAIRALEEEIGSVDDIEELLLQDIVFKDIDYFGLDNLLTVADYLEPRYGEPFRPPGLLIEKVKQDQRGVKTGKGFYHYY